MAIILLVLSLVIYKSLLPEIEQEIDNDKPASSGTLAFPQLVLAAVTLFFYVGVEVIAGDTICFFGKDLGVVNYTKLTFYTMDLFTFLDK
jgi:FHS family L-fucose permease-like MFS transporter